MVQGLLDFFTGGGDYADPTKIDPRYGVPMADVRQAAINSIGNMGALLLAAGQPMAPQQRAAYLAQLGQAGGSMNTDLYNASQRRLMQAQYQEKMDEASQIRSFGELMKDPEKFKAQTGYEVGKFTGMSPRDVFGVLKQVRAAELGRNPLDDLAKRANILQSEAATEKARAEAKKIADEQALRQQGYASIATAYGLPQAGGAAPVGGAPSAPATTRLLDPTTVQQLITAGESPARIAQLEAEAQSRASEEKSKSEKDLRGEFTAATKDFQSRQAAFKTMQDLARQGEGASDISLIMSLMKVYDPTSTVTGGEAANAQNAAGVPEALRAQYNMLVGGGKLSQTARDQLVNAGRQRYNQELDSFGTALDRYTTLARDTYKVRPEAVVTDYRDPEAVSMRKVEKERAAISRALAPLDIMRLNSDDIAVLDTGVMSAKQREALAFRIRQLEQDPNRSLRYPMMPNAPTPIPAPPTLRGELPRTIR